MRSAVAHTDVVLNDETGGLDRAVERRVATELGGSDVAAIGRWRGKINAARSSGDYWFSLPLYVVSCTVS